MIRPLSYDEIRALHYELKLKDIIATAEDLPPFPDVVWKVMGLIRRTAPVREIETAIKYDQAIAAKVLKLSQSAYYGRRNGTGSLQEAIVVLGSQRLIQVILTVCSARYYKGENSTRNSNGANLWYHSVSTAILGEMIARRLKYKRALSIYTAALLHDIGKTVLDLYTRAYLGASLVEMRGHGPDLLSSERSALGVDHEELGQLISKQWNFPAEVVEGIAHHHSPDRAGDFPDVACVVYAANRIVTAIDQDSDISASIDPEQDPIFILLGLSADSLEYLQAELSSAMDDVRKYLMI